MIRIGIFGAAGIAPQALIRPVSRRTDMEVVAVAARSLESATSFAREHGIPRAYEGYAELLAADDIDLVYVALPPSEHVRWSVAALEAGKDVLCEKPISMDAAQARHAAAVAERTGRHLIEAFHDHYHPLTAAVRDFVNSGALGTVASIDASFTADNPYSPTSIRHVPALGGGALMDLGCYPVHWLRELAGAEPFITGARFVPNELGADIAIDAEMVFTSGPHAGARGTLHASMEPGVPFAAPVVVTGDRGTLRVDNLVLPHRGHSVTTVIDGVTRTWTVAGAETYDHELDAVVTSLRTGTAADTEGEDFVATMDVIDAIYAAAGVVRPDTAIGS
ncbi:Gfo/Idh/MocA family protein [Microbacterium pygmaeum]|uniref:Predicted dehydrogenase n=1 Tax=Microbacterium pygmaeum TaxID=370764 RepID=A0A1G7X9A1_9MICO|nr:Gfo/Idh/MocA family oxidoreductase [Microbacterium pygmaeum]SDG80762.1 Predicted dehydrogenase [Microbacterium pygmaeum]